MARLFVAVWPPAGSIDQLAALPRAATPDVRWVPKHDLHVTLRFLGDVDPDDVAARLADCALPRVTARLGPATERLGGRQIVVPVRGVEALALAVRGATAGIGDRDRHDFYGHLTVARLGRHVDVSLPAARLECDFEVEEIALVASELLPDGAAYETIDRFPTR